MPPKKDSQKAEGTKADKQTKLFSKDTVEEPQKPAKSKSKQFTETSDGAKVSSETHTNLWKYGSGVTPNKLLISSWNVNGIRAVMNKN